MSTTLKIISSTSKLSTTTNGTSNLYRNIIKFIDLPEPLIVAIFAAAGLLVFIVFILFCSRCCCRKCCKETTDKDKYKKRKLETKEIDKILKDEFGFGFNGNFGKIQFAMKYHSVKELLIIKVIRVEDLPTPIDDCLDPYVILQIKSKSNNEEKQTKIKMKNKNPVFNEKFSFKVHQIELNETIVSFKVFDYDKFGADSLLGQLTLTIKDINVASIFNSLSEFTKDLQEGEDTSSGMGQICIILNNNGDIGLSVNILEAKNLRIKENSHFSHVFVTVKIKSRRYSKDFKTHAKKRTKDCPCTAFPYFNETFLFHKPHGTISDCLVSIKVWMSGFFKIPVCIGYVLLGSDLSMTSGEIHWQNMLDNPRHPVAKWHVLTSPNIKEIN